MLKVTQKTIGYTIKAEALLGELHSTSIEQFALLNDIKHYGDYARQVYNQTYRRVIQGESVPVTPMYTGTEQQCGCVGG